MTAPRRPTGAERKRREAEALGVSGEEAAVLGPYVVDGRLGPLPMRRAKRLAVENGIVLPQEREGMDKVLNAAAMTYVAAVVSTLMTLLYYLLRASAMSRR